MHKRNYSLELTLKLKSLKKPDTAEPRSTDTRLIPPDITDNFVCPDESLYFVYKIINPLITDTS